MQPQPSSPTCTPAAFQPLPHRPCGTDRPRAAQAEAWVLAAYREQAAECLSLAVLSRRHGPAA